MESILIANSDQKEIERIREAISNNYSFVTLTSAEHVGGQLEQCQLILLDQNFTEHQGIDFLMEVANKTYLPILMITSPEDPHCAAEALRSGAFNYIVKTGTYCELLVFSIKEAIARYSEREEMKRTIVALKSRVAELEEFLEKGRPKDSRGTLQKRLPPHEKKQEILNEIVSRLKLGEINLPSYPEVNIRFKQLLEQGANIDEITHLLKKDVAISSKLISVSNSPYYRGLTENKTLEQAISRLGLAVTRNSVELISNRALYAIDNKKYYAYLEDLWAHSLSCAYAAQAISRLLQLKVPEGFFSIGLLHDIGKLILLQIISELESKGAFTEEIDEKELK